MTSTRVPSHMYKRCLSTGKAAQDTYRLHRKWPPRVDIFENEHEVRMYLDMPGVSQDGVSVSITENVLVVEGQADEAVPGHRLGFAEYKPKDYRRTFGLSQALDAEKISANMVEGVLELILPKVAEHKVRHVPVTTRE